MRAGPSGYVRSAEETRGRERITVVFDLDDVLFSFVMPFLEWHNRRYGTDLTVEDLAKARYLFEAWVGNTEEATERVSLFFREVDVLGLEPIAGAVECLEGLQAMYQLVVVTARDRDFAAVTEAWIDKYFAGVFDRVILGIGYSERENGLSPRPTFVDRSGPAQWLMTRSPTSPGRTLEWSADNRGR